jgi:hypothetical protein
LSFEKLADLPDSSCPQCGYTMNSATNLYGDADKPDAGSFGMCLNCGQLLVYSANGQLRKPTRDEVSEVMDDPAAWHTIEKSQLLIKQRGRFK